MQERLAAVFELLARTAAAHGVEPVRSIGESWFGISGLSAPRLDHAPRSLAFAEDATAAVQRLGQSWSESLSLRIGLCSGEIDVGIGIRDPSSYDVWGRTLAIARRIAVDAAPGEIRVSESTFSLLPSDIGFAPCETIQTPAWGSIDSWHRPALMQALKRAAE